MEEYVFLDKDRIAVFLGKTGGQKRIFEKKFNCKLDIDSTTGKVLIQSEDSLNLFIIKNIITAINYGHTPQKALNLENEACVLDTIDLKQSIKDSHRLKTVIGRIIGTKGTTRKLIEDITKCNISIYEHYISIIGVYENTILVHEAIDMLIKGSSHKSLYNFLERNSKKFSENLI